MEHFSNLFVTELTQTQKNKVIHTSIQIDFHL